MELLFVAVTTLSFGEYYVTLDLLKRRIPPLGTYRVHICRFSYEIIHFDLEHGYLVLTRTVLRSLPSKAP